ncbi:MAG: hypothetical protein LBJ70_00125 [Holosporales bacterium]|jgi:hypothetical protein|nr:hypothetical protein [Holosporales bacterium]
MSLSYKETPTVSKDPRGGALTERRAASFRGEGAGTDGYVVTKAAITKSLTAESGSSEWKQSLYRTVP